MSSMSTFVRTIATVLGGMVLVPFAVATTLLCAVFRPGRRRRLGRARHGQQLFCRPPQVPILDEISTEVCQGEQPPVHQRTL